jgi:putative endonuclease
MLTVEILQLRPSGFVQDDYRERQEAVVGVLRSGACRVMPVVDDMSAERAACADGRVILQRRRVSEVAPSTSALIPRVAMSARTYTVYILTNRYRTVYYIGVTNDLVRRLRAHRSGRGSGFTARYRITDLIYIEAYPTPRDAIRREKQLKGWRRAKKLALICAVNPDLATLPGPNAG